MSDSERPDLAAVAKMRDDMMARLEAGNAGDDMEGLSIERLRDAMHRPGALETLAELLSSGAGAANEGMDAPDFELPYMPGHGGQEGETFLLSEHFGKRPVALIFGSYT